MTGEVPSSEVVVARLRPHGRRLFWPSLALLAIAGAAGYLFGRFPENWENLAVLGHRARSSSSHSGSSRSCPGSTCNYTITTRRIILRSGLLVRVRQELLHSQAHDITVRKSGLQSIFGSGDVLVSTGLDRPVTLRDVRKADLVQAALHDLMEAAQIQLARRQGPEGLPDETTVWGVARHIHDRLRALGRLPRQSELEVAARIAVSAGAPSAAASSSFDSVAVVDSTRAGP